MRHLIVGLVLSIVLVGCATVEMPEIPEFHPAHRNASEASIAPAFEVLKVAPVVPPDLPVPEGHQMPPSASDHGSMEGMGHGAGHQNRDPEAPATPNEPGHGSMEGMDHGAGHQNMKMETDQAEAPPASHSGLHGVIRREGMVEGDPKPGQMLKGMPDKTKHDSGMKHDAAAMQKIVIPSEQRGMGADGSLYHEHKEDGSTRSIHPDRAGQDVSAAGRRVWVCPMHLEVATATPGGRCGVCDAVLVPIRVVEAAP